MDWFWPHVQWWNRPKPRSFLLLLLIAAISYQLVDIFLGTQQPETVRYNPNPIIPYKLSPPNPPNPNVSKADTNNGSVVKKEEEPPQPQQQVIKVDQACPIPQLDPYDKSIEQLVRVQPTSMKCELKYSHLFRSTVDSRIIPVEGEEHIRMEGWESCCYRTVERNMRVSKPDWEETLSSECFPLSFTNSTKIPEAHEFIAIFCRNGSGSDVPVDAHAFVPLKQKLKEDDKMKMRGKKKDKLNVVIFGIAGTSRMNFLRVMPQTHSFLKNELGAVEMTGYNKVGRGTLENLIPLLTSKQVTELPCLNNTYNDDCPLIWKNYSGSGYSTCFSDDHFDFNFFSKGFHQQPTDHYPHPLIRWADANIGSYDIAGGHGCLGPRMTFQFHLDYMEKYVHRMSEAHRNFFHFTWTTMLAHDDLATGALGDVPLLKSIKRLSQSGNLNQTVLILMSDHGLQLGEFRNTVQGQLEDRLPFIFFLFPEWFQKKYAPAYQNLLSNSNKLMTVFDVHETLKDILNLDSISEASFKNRLLAAFLAGYSNYFARGLSLFLPIPESRTCQMAGIPLEHCSCNYLTQISLDTRPALYSAAMAVVSHINSLLRKHPQCHHLRLQKITMAHQVGWETGDHSETFSINFRTTPGGAEFETIVHRRGDQLFWTVHGDIARTSWYGNQSRWCVEEEQAIKPFCYCRQDKP